MPDGHRKPAREHLICAVAETSPLWSSNVLAVQPYGDAGQWVIEYEGPPPYEAGIDKTVAALRSTLCRSAPDRDRTVR